MKKQTHIDKFKENKMVGNYPSLLSYNNNWKHPGGGLGNMKTNTSIYYHVPHLQANQLPYCTPCRHDTTPPPYPFEPTI